MNWLSLQSIHAGKSKQLILSTAILLILLVYFHKRDAVKKVLILTYFFPPCNLTASQRPLGWAKYLNQYGYYPVIITRNWDKPIASPDDMHHDAGEKIICQKEEGYEVWYIPFRGNWRDKLYARFGRSRFNLLRKALSYGELVAHHFLTLAIPFRHIYHFASHYLKSNNDVKALIVTGNPFEIFRFGYLLNKKSGIPWIADYRDDWTTSEVNQSRGLADSLLRRLERRSEKRYIKTAACITTVSNYYAKKIGKFVGRPGKVILNGFVTEDFTAFQNVPLAEQFTIVYNGMLYPSQQISIFLSAFKQLVEKYPEQRRKIKLKFPGILFLKEVAESVTKELMGYEDMIEMSGRIPRQEVLQQQASAHLLLMVAHAGRKGIPSSKIYEYLALGKPVLICPGDDDILDETFKSYNLGYIANSQQDAFEIIEKLFNQFLAGNYSLNVPDHNYIAGFSRDIQTKNMAEILDALTL
jgi:glycosyltransferase involved in cell wall biosynthesis